MAAEQPFDPEPILRELSGQDVAYVVVGGFAVAAHGVIRATADLDVLVERGWHNAEKLANALARLRARDLTVPVASLDDLRVMKRAAGRPKDQVDLAERRAARAGLSRRHLPNMLRRMPARIRRPISGAFNVDGGS